MLLGSMYFEYGNQARSSVLTPSTFDAVVAGFRTSTTRFPAWPGYHEWSAVRMGARLRFFSGKNLSGSHVDCIAVADAAQINLATCSEEALEEWSRAEGWNPSFGRSLGLKYGVGVQIRYRLTDSSDLRLKRLV